MTLETLSSFLDSFRSLEIAKYGKSGETKFCGFYFLIIITFKALKINVLIFNFIFEYWKWKPWDRNFSHCCRAKLVFPNEMQLNFSGICVSLLHEMSAQMTTLSVPKVTR